MKLKLYKNRIFLLGDRKTSHVRPAYARTDGREFFPFYTIFFGNVGKKQKQHIFKMYLFFILIFIKMQLLELHYNK